MTRTTFYIILLCVFLVFLGITGWIVHWNIQFRKDLFLSTFIEVENDKELRKKFEDVERFAEDLRKELQKANEQTNGKFSAIAKRVQNAPDDSVPRIFVTFLRDKLAISPNTHYKSENGQLYYYLEKGPAKVKLKLRNHFLKYKIAEVESLAKFLIDEKRYGKVVEEAKTESNTPFMKKERASPPMVNMDTFNKILLDQLHRGNVQTNGQWQELENQLQNVSKDSILPIFIGYMKSITKLTNTDYERINQNTTIFKVQEIFPRKQDTIELRVRMVAGKNKKFKVDRLLNLDEYIVKRHRLKQ
jgi:hypothetical protein